MTAKFREGIKGVQFEIEQKNLLYIFLIVVIIIATFKYVRFPQPYTVADLPGSP